jgi:hypothetical protein
MSTEVYAAALVKHLDSSTPKPWFWKGTNSTVTWVVSNFMPKGGFVCHVDRETRAANTDIVCSGLPDEEDLWLERR